MNWFSSDRFRFLRIIYTILGVVGVIFAVFLFFDESTSSVEDVVVLATVVFSVLAAPPVSQFIERAFWTANNTGAEDVRRKLDEYWLQGYLRAEERTIAGVTIAKEDANTAANQDQKDQSNTVGKTNHVIDLNCQLPIRFEPVGQMSQDTKKIVVDEWWENISTIFDQFHRLVQKDQAVTGEFIILMGERGSRKTMQLLQLAEHLLGKDTRVPIYLNLFSWAASAPLIEDWIIDEVHRQYDILKWKVRHMIKNNYMILLLDGFEEVPHERRTHLIHALKTFLDGRTEQFRKDDPYHDGEPPTDLRDSIVIAVENPDGFEDKDYPAQDEIDNDLHIHINELFEMLKHVSYPEYASGEAPVLTIKIKPLSSEEVENYLKCHLTRKARETFEQHGFREWDANFEKAEYKVKQNPDEARQKAQQNKRDSQVFPVITSESIIESSENECVPAVDAIYKEVDKLKNNTELIEILRYHPFLIRAMIATYYYDLKINNEMFRVTSPQDIRVKYSQQTNENEDINITWADYSLDSIPDDQADKKDQILAADVIEAYVKHSLKRQPGNIGPYGSIERQHLLNVLAKGMNKRRQRVLDKGDEIFYLEEIGLGAFAPEEQDGQINSNHSNNHDTFDRYRGLVASLTTLIFLFIYAIYLFALYLNNDPLPTSVANLMGGIILVFGRLFGWASCGSLKEDRARLSYPLRWFKEAGVTAAIFMSIIIFIAFFEMTETVYGGINNNSLLYEGAISAIFSFAFFLLVGGMELGRRFKIVAHPYEGRQFLLVTTVLSIIGWSIFFFTFMFWPRTRLEALPFSQVSELVIHGLKHASLTGAFIGVMSGIVLSHLYLRHLVLYMYLRMERNMQAQYRQVLKHSAQPQIGLLRQLGGGYLFRHRAIMDYFDKKA